MREGVGAGEEEDVEEEEEAEEVLAGRDDCDLGGGTFGSVFSVAARGKGEVEEFEEETGEEAGAERVGLSGCAGAEVPLPCMLKALTLRPSDDKAAPEGEEEEEEGGVGESARAPMKEASLVLPGVGAPFVGTPPAFFVSCFSFSNNSTATKTRLSRRFDCACACGCIFLLFRTPEKKEDACRLEARRSGRCVDLLVRQTSVDRQENANTRTRKNAALSCHRRQSRKRKVRGSHVLKSFSSNKPVVLQMEAGVRLIVNADDVGYCLERNHGVLHAIANGIVTSVSILVGFPAEEHASAALKPLLDRVSVGLHFNLTEGPCIADAAQVPSLVNDAGFVERALLIFPDFF